MAETATLGQPAVPTESDVVGAWRFGVILRDIARGGLAGLAVGIVVGGIGGRLAMRLIALLIPESTGRFTENGARIGDITLGGTFALLLFGGVFAGIFVGTIWVVVSPWLPRSPGSPRPRGDPAGDRPRGVRRDPGQQLGLPRARISTPSSSWSSSAWSGWSAPRWRSSMPGSTGACRHPRSSIGSASGVYIVISAIGALFAVGVVATFLDTALRPVGIALLVSGVVDPRAGGISDIAVPTGRRRCSACWGAAASSRRSCSASHSHARTSGWHSGSSESRAQLMTTRASSARSRA